MCYILEYKPMTIIKPMEIAFDDIKHIIYNRYQTH